MIGVIKGDIRSLDYSSQERFSKNPLDGHERGPDHIFTIQ